MTDEENALKIFTDALAKEFKELRPPGDWYCEFDEEWALELGMEWSDLQLALQLLVDVRLAERRGMNAYTLTQDGRAASRDPRLAKAAIWPPEPAPTPPNTVFDLSNSTFGGPVLAGHHGTQNVTTYTSVLQSLAETIEKADIPPEEKRGALAQVAALLDNKTVQGLLNAAVGAGAAQFVKSKLGQ